MSSNGHLFYVRMGLDKLYYRLYSFWYRYNLDSSFFPWTKSIEDIYNMSNTEFCFILIPTKIYICIYLLSKTTLGEAGRDTNTTLSISISIYICIKIDIEHFYIYFVFCFFFGSVDNTLTRETESTIQGRVEQGVAK